MRINRKYIVKQYPASKKHQNNCYFDITKRNSLFLLSCMEDNIIVECTNLNWLIYSRYITDRSTIDNIHRKVYFISG